MTRFLLSLDQAVDTVFAALREARAGEIYVPDVPSATVINIAQALIGERKIEIKITGIRPGEKMHEIMVSEEEANHCVKRGEFYAIKSMLPELRSRGPRTPARSKRNSAPATTFSTYAAHGGAAQAPSADGRRIDRSNASELRAEGAAEDRRRMPLKVMTIVGTRPEIIKLSRVIAELDRRHATTCWCTPGRTTTTS